MGEFADMEVDRIIDQVTYFDQDSSCFVTEDRIRDPLYYHTEVEYEEIIAKTDKAVLLRIVHIGPRTNKQDFSKEIWIPKSLCRKWNLEDNSVYIWKDFFKPKRKLRDTL